jgi:hypothetical protein
MIRQNDLVILPDGRVGVAGAINHGITAVVVPSDGTTPVTVGTDELVTVGSKASWRLNHDEPREFGRIASLRDAEIGFITATRSSDGVRCSVPRCFVTFES